MRKTLGQRGIRRAVISVGASALIGTATVILTGCNDDVVGKPVATPTAAAPSGVLGGVTGAAQPAGAPVTRTIGKTGWFEGFEITVDKATVTPGQYGGATLVVDITYRNTAAENKALSANAYLQLGGQVDTGASFDNPTVPGKGSATGKITTALRADQNPEQVLDSAIVVYGQATDNQAKIPLAAAGKVDSVRPRALTVAGKLVSDQTTIEITGGTLTPSYAKNERGKYELALHVRIVGGAGIADGGTNIFDDYFSVKSPDGQSLVADSRSPINELLEKNQTIDSPKNNAVFLVAAPGTGNYVLTYDTQKGDGTPAPTFAFTVS
ncbi:hypothetical protein [Nocardia pseudobrasiliensis]|uniref:Uncharacterized protein n=1 Tax=Nocardia pseudobrasiliensis TaxID=45979 RepID=A0A370I213_9NOCA|nr:hypothetical protein [Nocardia pseudobrasiliensis]RDI64783.1 hypothetical protein DFR76_107159 [Nocardia pseudobrasiliensis]